MKKINKIFICAFLICLSKNISSMFKEIEPDMSEEVKQALINIDEDFNLIVAESIEEIKNTKGLDREYLNTFLKERIENYKKIRSLSDETAKNELEDKEVSLFGIPTFRIEGAFLRRFRLDTFFSEKSDIERKVIDLYSEQLRKIPRAINDKGVVCHREAGSQISKIFSQAILDKLEKSE